MQVHSRMSRIAAAAIVTAAVAVTPASGMPTDGPGSQTQTRESTGATDLRTEGSKGPSTSPAPPAGMPYWPNHPEPIVPAPAEPVPATDGGGGGLDWPAVLIIAVGAVALTGGLVVKIHQTRALRSGTAH